VTTPWPPYSWCKQDHRTIETPGSYEPGVFAYLARVAAADKLGFIGEGDVPPPRRRVSFVVEQKKPKINSGASAPEYPGANPETGSLHPARKI
jgi:hypothetical protein